MRITILPLIVALSAAPLWAQKSEITWENYSKNSRVTRLGYDLKMIAAMNHPTPSPEVLGQLVAQGLASGEFDSQEGALMVIVSMSGVLHPATPEEFTMWEAYHPTLVAFRKQVEAMLYDADVSLRSSAHSALTALNYRPGKDSWTVDLDAAAVKTYVDLFQQDPEPFIRAKTVQLFTLCQCNESTTEARKQLFREAIYDTDPTVVRISIRGAADLKIADMVPRIVQLLDDDDEDTRHNAATAIQVYGRDAGRFSNELRAALAKEKNAEIREILKYSLQGIE